jgi:hypothetical protein
MRSSKTHSKRKREKRKRFQRGWMSECKLFDLKIFLVKELKGGNRRTEIGKILSETQRA